MRPQHPEPRDLDGIDDKLLANCGDHGTRSTISGEERWRVLALQRIQRVVLEGLSKECPVYIQKSYTGVGQKGCLNLTWVPPY